MIKYLCNIAIIAHVDHGKTTLIDQLLQQSGTIDTHNQKIERIMDCNDLEKERGITILSKNTAITWKKYHINIIDTPGHADFSGEVERVLSMVDSVLLVVDAVDGPMPQTRFVTEKAFTFGFKPIVVINKVDRPNARPNWVVDQIFDLFDRLGATDAQLDFPIVYTSAINGYASFQTNKKTKNMEALFQTITDHVEQPHILDVNSPFQMQISSLDYSSFTGTIGIGRIKRGSIKNNTSVMIIDKSGNYRQGRILKVLGYMGLNRIEIASASANDIICVTGIDGLNISDTLCAPECIEALPPLTVDEPTISMTFQVNKSPLAGTEGKFITSRQIKERLKKELLHNVALDVQELNDPDKFKVSGRGELHLSILLENMRREGFEIAVSRPQVVVKEIAGEMQEPYEHVTIDVNESYQGNVIKKVCSRQGELKNMFPDEKGRVKLEFIIPSRGLIGFYTEFLTITSGTGLINKMFYNYGPMKKNIIQTNQNGALISNCSGKTLAFSLFNLQERGKLFINHGDKVYKGMIIGINNRNNDLTVNPCKAKKLSNVRASSGKDESIILTPPIQLTMEYALEIIKDDELIEITPKSIRLRKKYLNETERKQSSRIDCVNIL